MVYGRRQSHGRLEAELKAIVNAIEAYEVKRWPLGKHLNVPRGKG